MNHLTFRVLARLTEPSTYAGLAGIAQGLKLVAPHYAAAFDLASLLLGGIAAGSADKN